MKRKIKKYRPVRAFFITLSVCMLIFLTAAGISAVYMRTELLRTGEARPAFSVVSGKNGRLSVSVLGQEKSFILPEAKAPSPLEYALVPPEIRIVWQGLLYFFGELTQPQ